MADDRLELMRKRYVAAAALVVAAAGTAGAVLASGGRDGGRAPRKAAPPTAAVTRGDLVDTTSVDGTLTYADERRVTGHAAGTITAMPSEGAVIRRGDALYRVDRKPVVLMYGRVPLYRELRPGMADGPDVRQLETGLRALGYGAAMTVDDHFSAATAGAVRAWQEDAGLPRTGRAGAAELVFLPSSVRVTETKAEVGDEVTAGRRVLTVTGTRKVVRVDLDADRRRIVRTGGRVSVEMPGGTTARGKVAVIGKVARKKPADASTGDREATISVGITLTTPEKAGYLDQAPVTVLIERRLRRDVLSVPVEALLASRAGGYGVEVVGPGGRRRVTAVTTGTYGGGRVEISGPGLRAGTRIGVPAP